MKRKQILINSFTILIFTFGFSQNENFKKLNTNKFNINLPLDWKIDESGKMGTKFILFSPLTTSNDNFSENINLVTEKTPNDFSLDNYVKISENQIKTMLTNGKIISSDRKKINNTIYHKITFTGKQGVYDLKFQQRYLLKNNTAYVLTLTCTEEEFENYLEVGENILDSFILN